MDRRPQNLNTKVWLANFNSPVLSRRPEMIFVAKTTTSLLLGCILICCTHSSATAQDADAVVKRCTNKLNQINEGVSEAQRRTVQTCVPAIERLIEAGKLAEARQAAERCRTSLDSSTERGTRALRETCNPCVRTLRELKAFGLARRLSKLCESNAQQLVRQNRRAQNIINELF